MVALSKGNKNDVMKTCFIVLVNCFQICANYEETTKTAYVSPKISTTTTQKSKDVTDVFTSNSSLLSKLDSNESIEHLRETPQDFNVTETLDQCLKNASNILDCLHLLDIQMRQGDFSLDSILQNMCSSVSPGESVDQEGSIDTTASATQEKTSNGDEEKSVILQYLTSTLSAFGILCNLSTIVVILQNVKLRKPFFTSIVSLALADILYQVNFLLNEFLESPQNICEAFKFQSILHITTYATKMFSSLNVVVLLSLRYALFVHPIKSRVYLTSRKICVISGLCLILSIAYSVVIVEVIWSLSVSHLQFLYIVDDGLLFFVIVLNIYFVVNRCKTIKSSLAAKNLKKRMIIMVFIILLLRTVNSLFSIVQSTQTDGIRSHPLIIYKNIDKDFILQHASKVLQIFVHSVNPFVYFFSSTNVLKLFLSCLRCYNE